MKVEWHHILLLIIVLVSGIICNTSNNKTSLFSTKRTKWNFLNDSLIVSAREVATVNNQLIYKDLLIVHESVEIFKNNKLMMITNFNLLPIVRKLESGSIEILLGIKAPEVDKINRLIIKDNVVTVNDTLPMLKSNYFNKDKDNVVEFNGFLDDFETYCSVCDSVYYNPLLYYEMSNIGFRLDTLMTKNWIEKHYHSFHGFKPNKNVIVKLKSPVTEM